MAVASEYAVRRANNRVHAAFTVDDMNETDLLVRMSCRVPVGKSSICESRECPAEETSFASVARKDFFCPPWNGGIFRSRPDVRVDVSQTHGSNFWGLRKSIFQILDMRKFTFLLQEFSW